MKRKGAPVMGVACLVLCILILGRAGAPGPAFAQEVFLVGTVVSVNTEKMELEVLPDPPFGPAEGNREQKGITARSSAENMVVNRRGERMFPGCVYPGGKIRIWGRMESGILIISDIRGPGRFGRNDPTGVHRRLRRMCPESCPGPPGGGWK